MARTLAQLAELTRAARRLQAGVVTRRQVLAAGVAAHELDRLLRLRVLVAVHPGVYVDHTGPPSWLQRAWAAVLSVGPAALYGDSALRAGDGPGRREIDDSVIHVAIDRTRSRPASRDGVRIHQVPRLDETVMWHLGPPRQRPEHAALDAALGCRDDLDAIAVLARTCGAGLTTAGRVGEALAGRPRIPRRPWLESLLRDLASGTCSVLEHGYLTLVERPHGLPVAHRQRRAHGRLGVIYRDASYDAGAVVELDGRLTHDSLEGRDRDLERDLDVLVEGGVTARLGWRQVFARPCLTAAKVAVFLASRGVDVRPVGCSPTCPVWDVRRRLSPPAC